MPLLLLQAAYTALAALPACSSVVQPAELHSRPPSALPGQLQQQTATLVCDTAAAAGDPSILEASHPAARALASVLVQLSQAELLLARLQLQEGGSSKPAADPEFPRVEGRDPRAVIAFLTAAANSAQVGSARAMP